MSHSAESVATRYHPQVKRGETWMRPSVGGIDAGFSTIAEARSLIAVLRSHDGDYYSGCDWRVLETRTVTRVFPPREDQVTDT